MFHSIPTPTLSQFSIAGFTFHFYALCIIAGIAVAIWLGDKRLRAHSPLLKGVVSEVAIVAVPVGIIGGRFYHVISSPENYFGSRSEFISIFKIWEGGLGIWGAISLGAVGAYFSYRHLRKKMDLPPFGVFLDAIAPGILFAQAIGRFGNWFNSELFGRPLDTWWGLEIAYKYRPQGYGLFETFHPTFLYEAIWSSLVAVALILFAKNWSAGATFAAYVAAYSFGRFFIEAIRIDQANLIIGLRVNQWVSGALFIGAALVYKNLRSRNSF